MAIDRGRMIWVIERRATKLHAWKPFIQYSNRADATRQKEILGTFYRVVKYIPASRKAGE